MKERTFRAILLCALLVVWVHAIQAQDVREFRQRIDAAVQRGDVASAITELKTLRQAGPSAFALNNYSYLLARLSERSGDRTTAAESYQAVIAKRSVLSQYALWHLAEFARATGNLTLEREHLRRLIAGSPSSSLRAAAAFRLGQSFFESKDYPAAIAALTPLSAPKVSASSRAAMLLLAQAHLASGNSPAARETFNNLISQSPDPARPDDNSLAAARSLDELDDQNPGSSAGTRLSEGERLRRAAIYQFNRDFAAARRHYQGLLADYPQSTSVPDTQFQIGRGLFQEAKYEEAIKWFQQAQQKTLTSATARDALAQMAGAQNRLKRTDEAVASYVSYLYRYPDAPNPERPYLNLIDVLREAGRDNEALRWVQQTRQRFSGQTAATLALFSQARIHFSQADWSAALEDVAALQKEGDLGGAQTAGSTNQSELAFMRAFALEQLGRTEEAVSAYLALPDGRSEYYGGQATQRLRGLAGQSVIGLKLEALRKIARQASDRGDHELARSSAQAALRLTVDEAITRELLEIARRAYQNLPAYNPFPPLRLLPLGRQELRTGNPPAESNTETDSAPSHQNLTDELLFLGLYDEGSAELAAASRERLTADKATAPQTNTADFDYTMAVYFMRGGNANQAMRFGQSLWKNVPRDYLLELAPRDLAQLLYPAPHTAALLAHGPARNVEPRFLLAIARQESGFLPEAKSASAARGLMQFISATAAAIATQLGKQSFRDEELYDPGVSILFGSQYLSNLFKRFPNMPQAVAASYNGGDENMARWIARARSHEADRYVLEIGFAQSKDYVYRVISNYRAYQTLYSDQLQPR